MVPSDRFTERLSGCSRIASLAAIAAPRNANAMTRLIRPRRNSSRSRLRESIARCLNYS
jgi:hypothetical protein